jgi:hypothetical protein
MTSKEEAERITAVQAALGMFADREPHTRRDLFSTTWNSQIGATGKPRVVWQYTVLDRLKQRGCVEHVNPGKRGATFRWIAVDPPTVTAEAAASWLWLPEKLMRIARRILPAEAEAEPNTPTTAALAELTTEQKLDVLVANVVYLREEWAEVRPMIERIYQDLIK